MFERLAEDSDNEHAMIDSTIVRAHQHSADVLLLGMDADTVITDKAFDADERVIAPLRKAGKTNVLPPKSNRTTPRESDQDLYRARHLIENFFARLKQFRAIATRLWYTRRQSPRRHLPRCFNDMA